MSNSPQGPETPTAPIAQNAPVDPPPEILGPEGEPVRQSITVSRQFSGPLPPPEVLHEFESVHPGLADRIVRMAEQQAEHRQYVEKRVVEGEFGERWRGQWFGLVVALFGLSISALLIYLDKQVSGTVLAGTVLLSLVSVFVLGSKETTSESNDMETKPRLSSEQNDND